MSKVVELELVNNQTVELVLDSGARGLSAYQIALRNGFVGTESEWLASLSSSTPESDKYLEYNPDGTLRSITTALGTRVMEYNIDGTLHSVTGTGVYSSKVFVYDNGKLISMEVI